MASSDDLDGFLDFAHELADLASRETVPRFRTQLDVANKVAADFDPVTDADREAERVIRARIEQRFAQHGIFGEEFGETVGDGRHRWVLDPVDGTRSFICGAPTWTTLIALEIEGTPRVGVIDQPYTGERWVGTDARTRYFRDGVQRTLMTSGCVKLEEARVSTTDPRPGSIFGEVEAAAFSRVAQACRLARFSMDAYAYALLASGQLDLVVEAGLQHYDYAALAPVVRGAGGVVSNWAGGEFDATTGGHLLASASPELHAAAMAILTRA